MLFRLLGRFVARAWVFLLLAWVAALAALWFLAPPWEQVGRSGQFGYLPDDAPSRRAEAAFAEAFPAERTHSSIVLVLTRQDGGPLTPDDLKSADQLAGRLRQSLVPPGSEGKPDAIVTQVRSPADTATGALLVSPDKKAALVVAELSPDLLDARNWPVVASVEQTVADLQKQGAPPGLKIDLDGSAVLGRDLGRAEQDSAHAVELWTVLIVVALLLIVYRAPLLAALPLVTVFVGVEVALRLLGLLAEYTQFNLYQGVRTYLTVVGYGAGVDYCLFMIARCREEWESGAGARPAVATAVSRVGAAIVASAATVVCGVAMMGFAEFGKIKQAGLGIAFGLVVVLLAALTFAPSLLCLTGRWAMWPRHRAAASTAPGWGERFWGWLGRLLSRRPATVGLTAAAVMAPFAVWAAVNYSRMSYDLTRNVPEGAPSSAGFRTIKEHFPPGWTGTITVLIKNDRLDFRTPEGAAAVGAVAKHLGETKGELGVADVRSLADPLGTTPAAKEALSKVAFGGAVQSRAAERYVGGGGHVTRLDVVPDRDPFAEPSAEPLDRLAQAVKEGLPEPARDGAGVSLLGVAPSMRDLQAVTSRDEQRVDLFVLGAVLVVLLALLRRPVLCLYLILTVVFGYLTALGVTLLVFRGLEGPGFPGPDWKVPFFLFTILVAVGEDYNIFLLTRVREETRKHGPVEGVTEALSRTGGVITSCGLIMAGTFSSLLAGSLTELRQMGFALAFGVLLDTLIVRPVLVPAFVLFRRTRRAKSEQPAAAPAGARLGMA